MKLSIVGCPDKERFRPYVKRAALFYAKELLSDKMADNITVKIRFNSKMDAMGYANVTDCNERNRPREFEIELYSLMSAKDILKTLAHEMVHVKQFAYGETNESLTRWKGQVQTQDDYWLSPWEVEAHGMEIGLFAKFATKEKLWEVFNNVNNLDDPDLDIEPLGWLEYDMS